MGSFKLACVSGETYDPDSLRARSEQALGELAQALLDSQVLENALAAAFGAREKAMEAQQAALAALNLPSAAEVERLERRIRSVSRRLEDVEDQVDRMNGEMSQLRRELKAADRDSTGSTAESRKTQPKVEP